MKSVRCAIYTRKSSEEGLEQAFNSLDAQREACAAYILSQASEGWTALPDVYDDGGLSGGSLERPALQRLLANIADAKVDIIVVYKVDRLTRSLLDFARLVEVFDKAGVSFVSITQSFNTTTSMGRLTLNMLLSFAQFEREVTAERIRDKIAASKARGMWMGGIPPLGYKPDGRTLAIVPAHAAIVRDIYARYLRLGNVRLVAEELQRKRMLSPKRATATGRKFGGGPFSRGQLYGMLRCPIYVGEIAHRGEVYPGLHEPIIDRDLWDLVQAKMTEHIRGERRGARAASPSVLAGRIIDGDGRPLAASHACKGTTRYRYYVSREEDVASGAGALRIPAIEIETVVAEAIAREFDDPVALAARALLSLSPSSIAGLEARARQYAAALRRRDAARLHAVVQQVRVHVGRVEIDCDTSALADALQLGLHDDAQVTITLLSDVRLTRSGLAMRLVQNNGATVPARADPSMIRLVLKARRWWAMLRAGEGDILTLARREGVSASYISRVLRLAFLAPAVVEAILAGTTKSAIDGGRLTTTDVISGSWAEQGRAMLPAIAPHGRPGQVRSRRPRSDV